MNRRRLVIWTLGAGASLCILLAVLVLIVPFLLGYVSIFSSVGRLTKGIEYPAELLDGNEDSLADLAVTGLPLKPVWENQSPEPIDRAPLYYAGHVILKGDKVIRSVTASSGAEEWRYESTNRIYAPYSDNIAFLDQILGYQLYPWPSQLHVIDLESGQDRWKTPADVRGLATGNGDHLFVTVRDSYQALDAANGQVIWTSETHPIERGSSPILYDSIARELYVWEDTRILVVLDAATGILRRRLSHTLSDGHPVIVDNGILYVQQSHPASFFALDGREDQTLWVSNHSPSGGVFQPMVYENLLYIRTSQRSLLAVNRDTGATEWQYPSDPISSPSVELLSNVVILDSIAYAIFSDAKLRGFDAITGQELGYIQFVDVSSVPYDLTVPGLASSDHLLFVSLGKTKLYAFEVIP